ncbi:hypothetical protein DAPPUDRAFT_95315 [Daphnia pulex]|uniref:Uncharacterized protein n=1 Tax=Daphnia pulex TaxID=6669 RepID=E9FVB6_DAPPU|nr:hypothetical protein DAPPUDRAFT_95315 [Daphnia pulex]|eukprot:EFX89139.1 hypothetical protein DAPPUDRAFT_95315 [Daphnia pulex]
MQFLFSSLVLLIASACVFVQAQSDNNNDEEEINYRAGSPQSSYEIDLSKNQGRFLFKTVTLSLQTSTFTTVTTKVTTCTTSTAGLSVCTASGRRRRGLHLSGNKEGRGLFYNEKEEHSEDGSIFLPLPVKEEEAAPVQQLEVADSVRQVRASPEPVPFVVQPGFDAPPGHGRLLFAFATTTITSTSTSTSTASLTAACQSTTGYQVCNAFGK